LFEALVVLVCLLPEKVDLVFELGNGLVLFAQLQFQLLHLVLVVDLCVQPVGRSLALVTASFRKVIPTYQELQLTDAHFGNLFERSAALSQLRKEGSFLG